MTTRFLLGSACGLIVFGMMLVGCGSKPSAKSNAANSSSPASYQDNSPSAQRYQQVMQQSSNKSPYSR